MIKSFHILLNEANTIHSNKYDYSKFCFTKKKIKSIIVCPKHGEFLQSMEKHIDRKQGCKKCFLENKFLTIENVINRCNKIHNNYYNYSKFKYINAKIKSIIICPNHGEFLQNMESHLFHGWGCRLCANDKKRSDLKDLLKKANIIHNNFYSYENYVYKNINVSGYITCPKHGDFLQSFKHHINHKTGCPKCQKSKGETKIISILETYNIKYITEYTYSNLVGISSTTKLRYDFFIPEFNLCIEFQGQQHYEPAYCFSKKDADEKFKTTVIHDKLKKDYCLNNNINYLEIPYFEYNNCEKIILDKINILKQLN